MTAESVCQSHCGPIYGRVRPAKVTCLSDLVGEDTKVIAARRHRTTVARWPQSASGKDTVHLKWSRLQ